MQGKRWVAAVLGVGVLVIGCTRTNAALMDQTIRLTRTCPDAVKIFSSPAQVTDTYTEVALLNSTGNTGFTSEGGMMKSMRKKAANIGANGIILTGIDEPSAGAKVASAFLLGTGADRKGKSVAIYIPADTARVRRACVTAVN